MAMSVVVLAPVHERMQRLFAQHRDRMLLLLGLNVAANKVVVCSLARSDLTGDGPAQNRFGALKEVLPRGLGIVGVAAFQVAALSGQIAQALFGKLPANAVIANFESNGTDGTDGMDFTYHQWNGSELVRVPHTIAACHNGGLITACADITNTYAFVRSRHSLTIDIVLEDPAAGTGEISAVVDAQINAAVEALRTTPCGVYLHGGTGMQPVLLRPEQSGELGGVLPEGGQEPVNAELCFNMATAERAAPCIVYSTAAKQYRVHSVDICVDVLLYLVRDAPIGRACTAMVEAIQQQLRDAAAVLKRELASGTTSGTSSSAPSCCSTVAAYHFQPPGLLHPVTVLYPMPDDVSGTDAEEALQAQRERLHDIFELPKDRPLFRIANALSFDGKAADAAAGSVAAAAIVVGGRLKDVHAAAQPSGVVGGRRHMVDGSYGYYHYLQDGFSDDGWGCAYRSLQTIWSWFILQDYTQQSVPPHRQIQSWLVSMKDKPSSFIGSREWIGAIELGRVLENQLGIQYKIIFLNSGSDMASKAREIATHFDIHGTPVMIGGGVLAYTLLGIDWNESTGDCAFLILDPHYTGGNDMKKIVNGGWVSWKQVGDRAAAGGPLFDANSFYNLMCPQRPSGI